MLVIRTTYAMYYMEVTLIRRRVAWRTECNHITVLSTTCHNGSMILAVKRIRTWCNTSLHDRCTRIAYYISILHLSDTVMYGIV